MSTLTTDDITACETCGRVYAKAKMRYFPYCRENCSWFARVKRENELELANGL
jgi:hypothetical protein